LPGYVPCGLGPATEVGKPLLERVRTARPDHSAEHACRPPAGRLAKLPPKEH
jgi:hypothetical protein